MNVSSHTYEDESGHTYEGVTSHIHTDTVKQLTSQVKSLEQRLLETEEAWVIRIVHKSLHFRIRGLQKNLYFRNRARVSAKEPILLHDSPIIFHKSPHNNLCRAYIYINIPICSMWALLCFSNTRLFCEYKGLYCGFIGLFCGYRSLFCRYEGLFSRYTLIRLFWRIHRAHNLRHDAIIWVTWSLQICDVTTSFICVLQYVAVLQCVEVCCVQIWSQSFFLVLQ